MIRNQIYDFFTKRNILFTVFSISEHAGAYINDLLFCEIKGVNCSFLLPELENEIVVTRKYTEKLLKEVSDLYLENFFKKWHLQYKKIQIELKKRAIYTDFM